MKVRFLPLRQAYRRFSAGKSGEIRPRLWETHRLQQPCDLGVVNKLRQTRAHCAMLAGDYMQHYRHLLPTWHVLGSGPVGEIPR